MINNDQLISQWHHRHISCFLYFFFVVCCISRFHLPTRRFVIVTIERWLVCRCLYYIFVFFFLPVKLDEKKEIIRYFFLFRSFFLRLSLSLAALFFTLSSSFFCLPISTFTVITTIIASWACLSDLLLLCMHIYLWIAFAINLRMCLYEVWSSSSFFVMFLEAFTLSLSLAFSSLVFFGLLSLFPLALSLLFNALSIHLIGHILTLFFSFERYVVRRCFLFFSYWSTKNNKDEGRERKRMRQEKRGV